MKWFNWRVVVGAVLVLFGGLYLLQSFGVIPGRPGQFEGQAWGIFFGVLFLVVGVSFLPLVFQDRLKNWWAVIPGLTLIGLGLLILIEMLWPGDHPWVAALFLGGIGLSFLVVYLLDRSRWWAIIPAGVLLSLTVLIAVADEGIWPVIVLFGGMAVTFGAVALTAKAGDPSRAWAWYPAGILALLAVIFGATSEPLPGIIWPILLIAAGLVLVGWTLLRPKK